MAFYDLRFRIFFKQNPDGESDGNECLQGLKVTILRMVPDLLPSTLTLELGTREPWHQT